MPYTLIKGELHIHYPDIPRQGPEPDGDTIKFLPDNRSLVEALRSQGGPSPRFNGRGMINLRFEGIDALETHFEQMHQDMAWANAARDELLSLCGFGNIQYWADLPHKVETVQNHPRPGYILARTLDTHGRIIAFVFAGSTDRQDGSNVIIDAPLLNQSLNGKLMAKGLVYPLFYTTLPIELQNRFMDIAIQAWNASKGLWPHDVGNPYYPASIPNLAALENLCLWPKLFRRLAAYFGAGNSGLGNFMTWLRADATHRDDRVLLPTGEVGNMHDVLEISGNQIQMVYWPEELVILPDGA
jgi:hypothetical protein